MNKIVKAIRNLKSEVKYLTSFLERDTFTGINVRIEEIEEATKWVFDERKPEIIISDNLRVIRINENLTP